jgi:hypothetical protein
VTDDRDARLAYPTLREDYTYDFMLKAARTVLVAAHGQEDQ